MEIYNYYKSPNISILEEKINYHNSQIIKYNPGDLNKIKGAGVICINSYKDEVLIISNNKNKKGFPKGYLKTNEKYIKGAFREFSEETGLKFYPFNISGFLICKNVVFFIVFCNIKFKLDIQSVITKKEIINIEWINIYNLYL